MEPDRAEATSCSAQSPGGTRDQGQTTYAELTRRLRCEDAQEAETLADKGGDEGFIGEWTVLSTCLCPIPTPTWEW